MGTYFTGPSFWAFTVMRSFNQYHCLRCYDVFFLFNVVLRALSKRNECRMNGNSEIKNRRELEKLEKTSVWKLFQIVEQQG